MRSWLGVLFSALTGAALADPGYDVVTPCDQAGHIGAEVRYWTTKAPNGDAVPWPEVGLSCGVSTRWTTRLLASWEGESLRGEMFTAQLQWLH